VAAAGRAVGTSPPIGYGELLGIFAEDPLADTLVQMAEDPCDNFFTESVMFHGGGYLVLPGISGSPSYIIRNLAKAIFSGKAPFPDAAFVEKAEQPIRAALATSDLMARQAGLTRWMRPSESEGGITVPDLDLFLKLKAAVKFPEAALRRFLASIGLRQQSLEALIVERRDCHTQDWDLERALLSRKPVVRSGESLIIAVPGSLLLATINAVLELASDRGMLKTVANRYTAAVWDSVRRSLEHLDLGSPQPIPIPHEIECLQDAIIGMDTDKALHVLVVTDPLDNFKPWLASEPIDRSQRATLIDCRIRQVETWLAADCEGTLNDIMHVIVVQGCMRDQFYAFSQDGKPTSKGIVLTGEGLDVIALKEGGDPLALWKFVQAREHAHRNCGVVCLDTLDEYAFYIDKNHSYYTSDGPRPTALMIEPGFCAQLRYDVIGRRDFHGVLSYDHRHIMEVTRLFDTGNVPIFLPLKDLGRRAALLVEELPIPVWVLGPEYKDDDESLQHSSFAKVVEAIAYWMWQFTSFIRPVLQAIGERHRQLEIRVQLPGISEWERQPSQPDSGPVCAITPDSQAGQLLVRILPALSTALSSETNQGEREFVRHLLVALSRLLPPANAAMLCEQRIAEAIGTHAPLGLKKKLLMVSASVNPSLHQSPDLPHERGIQDADEQRILDDVGEFLISKGWPMGRVQGNADELLKQVVAYLYGRVEKLVASLSPKGILEKLVAQQERMEQKHAHLRLTVPTRIACFENEREVIEDLQSRLPKNSHFRLASRFIIEYIAARPPSGIRPMSISVYDELIALAAHIVNFGALSDLTHYEIEEVQWFLLESKRPGWDQRSYKQTRQGYLASYACGQVHRAMSGFADNWSDHERKAGELQDKMNSAMNAEVGLGFTEIMDVLGVAIDIGLEEQAAVCVWQKDKVLSRIQEELHWPAEKVHKAFALLSLGPRADFLSPEGFRQEDVYPWRLDRSLSYLRRPFIVRNTDGREECLWGFRHVYQVTHYLIDAWLHGRIEAKSAEMKKLVGELQNQRGEAFNNKVAARLEGLPGLIVKKRVKKVGKLRPPGDIDILVAVLPKRELRIVECKDLEPGRMPHEMHSELLKVFIGEHGKKSAVEKHLGRLKWVQEHLPDVLEYLKCNDGEAWAVEALFVTNAELLSPFLRDSPVRFVPIAQIESIL